MSLIISPGKTLGRDGGSFQECSTQGMFETVTLRYGRYCTIRDHETVPPTRLCCNTQSNLSFDTTRRLDSYWAYQGEQNDSIYYIPLTFLVADC